MMAIDTRQKRFSMMSFGSPIHFAPMFEADGSIDADDRAHMLNLYSGIALDDPSPPVVADNDWLTIARRRKRR